MPRGRRMIGHMIVKKNTMPKAKEIRPKNCIKQPPPAILDFLVILATDSPINLILANKYSQIKVVRLR